MKTLYESILESLLDINRDSIFKLIDSWCKNNVKGKYEIDKKTLTINSSSDIQIIDKSLTEFPSYIHFGTVKGDFFCSGCGSLKSLKGVPKEVGRDFLCNYCNSLTSLEGMHAFAYKRYNIFKYKKAKTLNSILTRIKVKYIQMQDEKFKRFNFRETKLS